VALHRGFDGMEPIRPERIGRPSGRDEALRRSHSSRLGTGTLACPACDAPVAPAGVLSPADPLDCPFCAHAASVRDFLSLAPPARPARVEVRIVHRARRAARG
jgi:hypothetical protein